MYRVPFALVALMFVATTIVLAASCGPPARQDWDNTFKGTGEDAFLLDDDFTCIGDQTWAAVDGDLKETVRVKNVNGHQDDAVAVATAKTKGDTDPSGASLQLFPTEASVKRGVGFSKDTNDWEFLQLDVGSGKTVITNR